MQDCDADGDGLVTLRQVDLLGSSWRRSKNPPAKRKRAVKKTAEDLQKSIRDKLSKATKAHSMHYKAKGRLIT